MKTSSPTRRLHYHIIYCLNLNLFVLFKKSNLLVHVIVHKRRTSGIEAIIEVKSSSNNLEQSDQPLVSVFHNSCACVHRIFPSQYQLSFHHYKKLHFFRPSISKGLLKRSKQTLKIDVSEYVWLALFQGSLKPLK